MCRCAHCGTLLKRGLPLVLALVLALPAAAMRGDVNSDGRVNVSDVTKLVNVILSIESVDNRIADVNGDGRVNVSDVTCLINIIIGVIVVDDDEDLKLVGGDVLATREC